MPLDLARLWERLLSTGADCLRVTLICLGCMVLGLLIGYVLTRRDVRQPHPHESA